MAHATDRGIPQIDSYEKWKHALEKTEHRETRVAVIRQARDLLCQFDDETRLKFLKDLLTCARNTQGGDIVRARALREFMKHAECVTFGHILHIADVSLFVNLTGFLEHAKEIQRAERFSKRGLRTEKRIVELAIEWLRMLSEGYREDFSPLMIELFEIAAVRVLHYNFQIMRIWRIFLHEPAMRKMRRLIMEAYPSIEAGVASGDETAACYMLMQMRRNGTIRREKKAEVRS
jgi:DNA-binding SARP family transcriptional activator